MKKFLALAAFAFVLASCGGNKALTVDNFYEDAISHIGQEVTVAGHAKVCCCSGKLAISNCDGSKMIMVVPAEGVTAPDSVKGATLKVKGIVSEEVIDEAFIAVLVEKANTEADSTAKADQLAKAEKIKGMVAEQGIIRKYTITASSIEIAKCDNKECKAGEGCEKKCEGNHEGCEKKCEGHQADTTAKQ